ncbi:MAG: BolA family protein [Gammaproteobacteria bacterium]
MNMKTRITQKLTEALAPEHLEVINESHMHNVPEGSESHFKVVIVSDAFKNKMLLARHRLVNAALKEELNGGIHALALHTMTMEEWFEKGRAPESPPCMGGDGSLTEKM